MDIISSSTFSLRQNIDQSRSLHSLGTYEEKTFKALKPQILAVIISSLNHIIVGISFGYSAILLPQLDNEPNFNNLTNNQKSWIASCFLLIVPIGALITGYLMDKIGRLNTLKVSAVPCLIGWMCMALAQDFSTLIIGRVLLGLASVLGTNPMPVYVAEVSHKDLRGSFLSIGALFVSIGVIMTYLKGWLMGWRLLAWLCVFYTVPPFVLLFWIKESPVWLIAQNRLDAAKQSLDWFYKNQPKPNNFQQSFAELQLRLLQKDSSDGQQNTANWRSFLQPIAYKPLLIVTGLFVFQQFAGIYIFQFYTITFFENVGTTINPYTASITMGVIRTIMSVISTWLFKQYTRRFLVVFSTIGMAISIGISGTFTYLIKTEQTDLTWIPVVCLLLYVVFSMVGLLQIPWTISAELFPTEIRSMAHCFVIGVAHIIMFLAIQNYYELERICHGAAGVQWFFAFVSLMAVIYTLLFMPETHQKKLSEIQQYFREHTIYYGKK